MRLLTFGHGTATQDEILALLHGAGVRSLVDIRTAPGSRRNPHVARGELGRWLPEAGVDYRWEPRLGGFRRPPHDSPDVAWRNSSFRGYAAHTRTPEFAAALDDLVSQARHTTTTVMCSEAVWWRCHRRLVADAVVLTRGGQVCHLMHDGRLRPHRLSPGVRVSEDGLLVYDGGQQSLG